jgi:hypothetical protein
VLTYYYFRRKDDDAPRGGKENVYDKQQQPETTNISGKI